MKKELAPVGDFFRRESISGLLIIIFASTGLLVANSPLSDIYFRILHIHVAIFPGNFSIDLSVLKTINYVLMTIFFFVVGLEIKRELTVGDLSTRQTAISPLVSALGGMLLPATIYLLIAGRVEPSGWGVPVATDIALALGLLGLIAKNVSRAVRSFLLALAVIDDVGAILIIAFVYSNGVNLSWLISAFASILSIYLMKRLRWIAMPAYFLVGMALWYSLYKTGIHPTLAGVILGLMTPNIPYRGRKFVDVEDGNVSIIDRLEHAFQPISTYFVVPLFAFANTGIVITLDSLKAATHSYITWGIFFGLVLGKPLGILLSASFAQWSKLATLPEGSRRSDILAVGSVAGIGFTVAIFIANLAFNSKEQQDQAVIAVIAAFLASTILSILLFRSNTKAK